MTDEIGTHERLKAGAGDSSEFNLIDLTSALLKRWRTMLAIPFSVALLGALCSLLLPAKYAATSTFVPEVSTEPSLPAGLASFAGLASQFGIGSLRGGSGSSQFYETVLHSRSLRDDLLLTYFPHPVRSAHGDSLPLIEILGVVRGSRTERLDVGRAKLDKLTQVHVDADTGVLSVTAATRYPTLSATIANHYLVLLNRFNRTAHRSTTGEQRRFIESQLPSAQSALAEAEAALERFLLNNRGFESSPELRFQHDRLGRQVAIKQEILTTLRREYEIARIKEVNDTPILTLIDHAVPSAKKTWPNRKLIVLSAFIVGGLIAFGHALAREYAERSTLRDDESFRQLTDQWMQVRREFRASIRVSAPHRKIPPTD